MKGEEAVANVAKGLDDCGGVDGLWPAGCWLGPVGVSLSLQRG